MITLKEVKKAKEDLKKINEGQDEFNKNSFNESTLIRDKYWELRNQLNEKEREETREKEKTSKEINDVYERSKENPLSILNEYREIIKFLEVREETKNYGLKEPLVYKYDYLRDEKGYSIGEKCRITYTPSDILIQDDYKLIYLYITKNRKPKNCISLIAVGNSIFTKQNGFLPYEYGIDTHIDDSNIRVLIKDFTSNEEACSYLNKNKSKILKDFLEKHKEKEEQYNEVIKLEYIIDWKIAVLEEKKYYYENNYSHGTETEEYKNILRKLEKLNNVVENEKI